MNIETKEIKESRNYLYGHISKETAYTVEDYPWGFRLRTKKRYWIESRKGYGQRFCSQTLNPKTNIWCAPKYDIYYQICVLFLNGNGHVSYETIKFNDSIDNINSFISLHIDKLDDFQREQYNDFLLFKEYTKDLVFKCKLEASYTFGI